MSTPTTHRTKIRPSPKGESVIENAQMVDRGYEQLDAKLRALGADIVREE